VDRQQRRVLIGAIAAVLVLLAIGIVAFRRDQPTSVDLVAPAAIAVAHETVFIGDPGRHEIVRVGGSGRVASFADVDDPAAIAVAPDGQLVVADRARNVIRRIDPQDGSRRIIAGSGREGTDDTGHALAVEFSRPEGVAVGADGVVYIADSGNDRVVALDTRDDQVRAFAETDLRHPTALAVDSNGDLWVNDSGNHRVVRIDGETRAVVPAEHTFSGAAGLAAGPDGAVYLSDFYDKRTAHPDPDADWDRSNGRIYKIEATGAKPAPKIDVMLPMLTIFPPPASFIAG